MTSFHVKVYDNYHYMNDEESYLLGPFSTESEAIEKCKEIVRSSLADCGGGVKTGEDLMRAYQSFGDDPTVLGETTVKFSAWDYARQLSAEPTPDAAHVPVVDSSASD